MPPDPNPHPNPHQIPTSPRDLDQDQDIANLTRHVRALWHHVQRLEGKVTVGANGADVVVRNGGSSITLRYDGTILIKGKDITIEGSGRIAAKASGELTLRGSKVLQN